MSVRALGKLNAPLALTTSFLAVGLLFFVMPYASGYGVRPTTLFDNAWALWLTFGEWTHGIFVAPLCLGLFFLKRKELAKVPIHGSSWGLLVLFLAGLAYWFGALADLQYVGFLAVQFFVAGLVIWFLGLRFFGAIFFIWAFLSFAWPFVFLDQYIAFPLRLILSQVSCHFLSLIGIPTARVGTAILSAAQPALGITEGQRFSIDVADPCSGLHSLFALLMITAIYAIVVLRRWWQILITIAAAFPLAIFGNFCRILMLTFGTMFLGQSFALGSEDNPTWFHTGAGYLVYLSALGGVIALSWIFLRPRQPEIAGKH
ncbi:MAG: exosortase/archaeosortase family protein [Verrucomicrobia bacterium]|nr:exosortase/archaeosortase family protein [Verrucomicrobiota bacterium]